jgi:hypothetical protein
LKLPEHASLSGVPAARNKKAGPQSIQALQEDRLKDPLKNFAVTSAAGNLVASPGHLVRALFPVLNSESNAAVPGHRRCAVSGGALVSLL